MINEDKVILMTKLASYEENEGKKNIAIVHYFRSDYIGFQVLKSIIAATISFCAVFGIYLFYNFEEFMQNIYKMDLIGFGKSIIILYLCIAGVYGVITYVVYSYRYNEAKKSLKNYYGNLKKLAQLYDR